MDAVDADVLIYAAAHAHPFAARNALTLCPDKLGPDELGLQQRPVGSVLLLPEVLSKPRREGNDAETAQLLWYLARIDLRPVDRQVADLAVVLASSYRLRAADAVHLATGVSAGADRFITNNRKDFRREITEIAVTYPDDLEPTVRR